MNGSTRRPALPARRPHLLAAAIALAIAALPMAASAQDEPPADPNAPVTLEDVTVSAERREEDIQKVPVSVSALSAESVDIIMSGGDDIRALSGRLPSLQIESSFGRTFPRFYIRGLGNTDFDLNASQPVSLVYDDVVLENPILKGFPMFDIEQVELLRGPQGSLFGRNTPAGVVKLDSVKPTRDLDGYGQLNVGSYGTVNMEGAIGGGLSDHISTRLSAMYQHRDDWVENLGTGPNDELEGHDEFALRGQFLWEPSDRFSALVGGHVRTLNGTARLFRAGIIERGTNDFVDGYERDEVSLDGKNEQELHSWGWNARLRWDFDRVAFHSITGYESADVYSRGDIDGGSIYCGCFPPGDFQSLFPSESADGLPEHRQITQEFRLESKDWDGWNWQAGVYVFDEDITIESFSYDGFGGAENGYAVQEQYNQAWAVFGSAQWDITDEFTLRAGARWTHDEKDFRAQRFSSPFGFAGIGPAGPLTAEPSDSKASWDLSGTWSPSEHLNFYGRIATGFRAPSIQGRILFAFTNTPELSVADSEEVLSFEAGVKADFWDRRGRVSFGVFQYTVDGQQLIAVGGASNTAILLNADETVGRGFELDVQAYLTDHLLVTLGVSNNHTEINDDDLAVAPCGGGCTVTDPAGPVPGTVLIDGNPLPQAPEWVTYLTARWAVPMGAGEFFVHTDWSYRSEVNFFLYESEEFRGKSLLEGGLRVGYNWNYGDYEVAFFGRNILDEEAIVGGIDFNNLTGFVNEPRLWGLEFTARF
jgi:iron complex outermembrane receptor protein